MADEQTGNRLIIRKREGAHDGSVTFGGELEIIFNGEPLRYWQRVLLDLNHQEFVVAEITIALDELVVEADAAIVLAAAAKRTVVEGTDD